MIFSPICWAWLSFLWWLHRWAVVPVAEWCIESFFGTVEEICKSILRELFAIGYRTVNGVSSFFVSVFVDGSYYRRSNAILTPQTLNRQNCTLERMSTLNAFVAKQAANCNGACLPIDCFGDSSCSRVAGTSFLHTVQTRS